MMDGIQFSYDIRVVSMTRLARLMPGARDVSRYNGKKAGSK